MKGGVLDHLGDVIHRVAGGSRDQVLLCVHAGDLLRLLLHEQHHDHGGADAGRARRLPAEPGEPGQGADPARLRLDARRHLHADRHLDQRRGERLPGRARASRRSPCSSSCRSGWRCCVVGHRSTWSSWATGCCRTPARPATPSEYAIREYLSEVVVTPGSPLAGQALRDSRPGADGPAGARDPARRAGGSTPSPHVRLEEGDLLIVQAEPRGAAPGQGDGRDRDQAGPQAGRRRTWPATTLQDRRGHPDAAVGAGRPDAQGARLPRAASA